MNTHYQPIHEAVDMALAGTSHRGVRSLTQADERDIARLYLELSDDREAADAIRAGFSNLPTSTLVLLARGDKRLFWPCVYDEVYRLIIDVVDLAIRERHDRAIRETLIQRSDLLARLMGGSHA